MFGTIIVDSYSKDEIDIIVDSLDEICSPNDFYGWSSAGIYSFWNYYTKEILYIGLASDLCIRFKQHNGLLSIDSKACKVKQINDYFLKYDRIGYSILVQSSYMQPIINRNKEVYSEFIKMYDNKNNTYDYAGKEGLEYIRQAEGQLIETYKLIFGKLPPWNKIGGDIYSRRYATKYNYLYVIRAFSNNSLSSPLLSRCTIRELANNSKYAWFELQLHGVRIMMISHGCTFEEALLMQLNFNRYFENEWNKIKKDNYLEKKLII